MLFACTLLLVPPAPTQPVDTAKLVFAERYDQAFAEAVARNVPVLVLDFDGWSNNEGSEIDRFYEDRVFLEATDGAVLILASQEDHGSKKQIVDGREKTVCTMYGGVSCTAHRDVLPKVFADFGTEGLLVSPLFGISGPDRKPLARFEHEQTPSTIAQALKAASKHVGAGLSRRDYLRIQQGVPEIDLLINARDYAAAVELWEELKKIPGNFTAQQGLQLAEKNLLDAGRALGEQAANHWSGGRHRDALFDLEEVRTGFGKFEMAARAASQMAIWEKAPEAKPYLEELKADRAARQIYEQAVAFTRKGDANRALQSLEKLLKAHPKSRFSERAKRRLSELKARR